MKNFLKYIVFLLLVFISGCELNPFDKLLDPTTEGTLGNTSWGDWVIYDDDLRTEGSIMFIPGYEHQEVDFRVADQNSPQGSKCFKYSWDGEEIYNYDIKDYQHAWCCLSFIVATDWQEFGDDRFIKDFTPGEYTKITFWAKGALSDNTKVTFCGPNAGEEREVTILTNTWKQYTIELNQLTSIRAYFSIVFSYSGGETPGKGGIVYLDDIRFTK